MKMQISWLMMVAIVLAGCSQELQGFIEVRSEYHSARSRHQMEVAVEIGPWVGAQEWQQEHNITEAELKAKVDTTPEVLYFWTDLKKLQAKRVNEGMELFEEEQG